MANVRCQVSSDAYFPFPAKRFTIPDMRGHPQAAEAAPYYFRYINLVTSDNILDVLESQLEDTLGFCANISEEKSLHRYAPDKWSIRQVINHVSDAERVFLFRAFWFARGFQDPLPSYDQDISAGAAVADQFSWATHIEDFRRTRQSSLTFFRNLSPDAWMRSGIASDNTFTVRALAYIVAGHLSHHLGVLQQKYLLSKSDASGG